MKKLLVLSLLWLSTTIYVSVGHLKLQEDVQWERDFQEFLVYRKYLEGCLSGTNFYAPTNNHEYWRCVEIAYIAKSDFKKRMKVYRGQ